MTIDSDGADDDSDDPHAAIESPHFGAYGYDGHHPNRGKIQRDIASRSATKSRFP